MRMIHRPNIITVSLVALIVVAHLAFLLYLSPVLETHLPASYNQDVFADGYDQLAANLASGNGFRFYPNTARTLMREPGYPILLAGLILTCGNSLAAVKLLNLLLALATAWFTMLIARRVSRDAPFAGPIVVLAPPLLFLLHPGTLIAESRGGIEVVFAFWVTLFLLTVYKAIDSNKCVDYLVSGMVLGVTVLFRSTPMLFPLVLLAYCLLVERRVSRLVVCRNVIVMIFAMTAVLSPWIARNYSLTGRFVPTSSVLGVSAQAGQYIGDHLLEGKPIWLLDREAARERDQLAMQLDYPFEDGSAGYYQTFYKTRDEVRFSRYLVARVAKEYVTHPLLFARCLIQNVLNFWFAGKTWKASALNCIVQLPYLGFALFGIVIVLKLKKSKVIIPLVLFIGYIVAVHLPILAQARYSISLIPLVSVLATIGLVAAQGRWKEMRVASAIEPRDSVGNDHTGMGKRARLKGVRQ